MELSSYNCFYALFAGGFSALIGFTSTRDYLLEKFKRKHTGLLDDFNKSKNECVSNIDQFISFMNDSRVLNTKEEGLNFLSKAILFKGWIEKKSNELDPKTEERLIESKAYVFFTYMFFYLVSLIIMGGFSYDHYLKTRLINILAGNLTIFLILGMMLCSISISYFPDMPIRKGLIGYLVSLLVAIIWNNLDIGFKLHDICLISGTFLACAVPFILLGLRGYFWWPLKIRHTKLILKKKEKASRDLSEFLGSEMNRLLNISPLNSV